MPDVRAATRDDIELLARIAAAGFHDDPVFKWVFPDPAARLPQLRLVFGSMARDMVPDGGVVHLVDDACAACWRTPDHQHGRTAGDRVQDEGSGDAAGSPFPDDVLERLGILGFAMVEAHPHEPHWYLNVVSTFPERQGQGLGSRVLRPVLTMCDDDVQPAYLESTNPRNMSLYRRHGFEETGRIDLPDGPSLHQMWRLPGSQSSRRHR